MTSTASNVPDIAALRIEHNEAFLNGLSNSTSAAPKAADYFFNQSSNCLYEVTLPNELTKIVEAYRIEVDEKRPLAVIPVKSSAFNILHDFKFQFRRNEYANIEMVNTLIYYMDKLIYPILLYDKEKKQYEQIRLAIGEEFKASKVYGIEMLLRMIMKLPELLLDPLVPEIEGRIATNILFPNQWNRLCVMLVKWLEVHLLKVF